MIHGPSTVKFLINIVYIILRSFPPTSQFCPTRESMYMSRPSSIQEDPSDVESNYVLCVK